MSYVYMALITGHRTICYMWYFVPCIFFRGPWSVSAGLHHEMLCLGVRRNCYTETAGLLGPWPRVAELFSAMPRRSLERTAISYAAAGQGWWPRALLLLGLWPGLQAVSALKSWPRAALLVHQLRGTWL